MRKAKVIIMLCLMLMISVSCQNNTNDINNTNVDISAEEVEKPTQAELNEKMKATAVQAKFIEINGGEVKRDKKVFATGEVSLVIKSGALGSFILTTEEDEGYGIYTILDYTLTSDIKTGDEVTVYGTYDGKADDGTPKILATIIE